MIVIVSGPGGAGKSTVVDRLVERVPRLWLSRSWTTRARRPGEADDAYVFVDRETFMRRVDAGGFIEWTDFPGTGQLYGTPTLDVPDGRDVLLEIELDGARQVRALYPDAVMILVVAPSRAAQEERLRARGADAASVARRLGVGAEELRVGSAMADHVVVNDDVDRAAAEVAGILASYQTRR